MLFLGEEGSTLVSIEKYLKENFADKMEAVSDLTMAIRHAIQRGLKTGRFVKEGRYVKISDKYQTRERASRQLKSSSLREVKVKVLRYVGANMIVHE